MNYTHAQKDAQSSKIEVELKVSPNVVNVGDKLNLGIVIKNHGASTNVSNIKLLYPQWTVSSSGPLPLSLEPNQTKYRSYTTMVPYNLSAGTYQLVMSVNAMDLEYYGESSVEIRKFQAFDLSGELPVSIIGIIITGITAYFIVVYVRSGKFERNITEMILAGIVFGIISWFLIGKSIDQVGNSDIYDYLKAIAVAVSLAFLFSLLYVILLLGLSRVTKLLDKLNNYKVIREWRIARIRSDEGSWKTLFRNVIRIRDSIGAGYTFHVKVYLKENGPQPIEYTGLLWKYDEDTRNIVIHPRYVCRCYNNNKQLIVDSLLGLKDFTEALKKDKKYRKKLVKYIGASSNIADSKIILGIRNKLINTNNIIAFGDGLQEIDFSKFVRYVFEKMKLQQTVEYDNITFIPAENISSLEIVNYQTRYAIHMYRDAISPDFVIIPKTYTVLSQDVLQ